VTDTKAGAKDPAEMILRQQNYYRRGSLRQSMTDELLGAVGSLCCYPWQSRALAPGSRHRYFDYCSPLREASNIYIKNIGDFKTWITQKNLLN
jgi:hypothetical protein